MWMMPDSKMDLYIQTERQDVGINDQDLLELFIDMQSLFNQYASDTKLNKGVQSKLIELHDDFYTCVDIQAYKCMPDNSKNSNPVQYVLSFNPPLLLSNLNFSPMELIEIDNPGTPDFVLKPQAKIPPKTSDYLLTLDMSQTNTSWIRFVFTDRVKGLLLSCTIDKFFKSDYGFFVDDNSLSEASKSQSN